MQLLVYHSGVAYLPLFCRSGTNLTLPNFPLQRLFLLLLQWVNLFACFVMTLPSLLLEVQHPVRNFAARGAHHIDNGSELPGIIFGVESDSFTYTKAQIATRLERAVMMTNITDIILVLSW